MKKLIVILLALTLLSGCAFLQKTIGVLGKAKDIICSPTVDQVADAVQAIAFINSNPGVKAAVGTALAVFLNIRDKVCVNIPQVQAALSAFDAAVKQAQLKAVPTSKVPGLASLRAMVK